MDLKCLECGEELQHKVACVKHNMETNHNKFNIIGSDINIDLKVSK
jgi:hypothetical protein